MKKPYQRITTALVFIGLCLASFPIVQARALQQTPVLKLSSDNVSNSGHTRVEWKTNGEGVAVELQQADNDQFQDARTVYRGHDHATFISGLDNGTYYYRVRYIDGVWSDTVKLEVNHHSLQLAFILLALGAIVFGLTVFIVVKGALSATVD